MNNPEIKIKRITIFNNGEGYILIECAGRSRFINLDGKLEEGKLSGNRLCSLDIQKIQLGTLGTKNSYFNDKQFYPKRIGLLDLFGMGTDIKKGNKK